MPRSLAAEVTLSTLGRQGRGCGGMRGHFSEMEELG